MDFSRLETIIPEFNSTSNNATATSVPSTVLEMFVPAYSTIAQLTYRHLGFDIGVFVTGWLVLFGLYHGVMFTCDRAYHYFTTYYMSAITIELNDYLYIHVMSWVVAQHIRTSSRYLTAHTRYLDELKVEDLADCSEAFDEYGIFNKTKWSSNIPPSYQPNFGYYTFYHEGQWFRFKREKKDSTDGMGSRFDEQIVLCCMGRTTEPIKQLLVQIKTWSLHESSTTTSIYQVPGHGRYGDRQWQRECRRLSRPLSTVCLDQQQKSKIVADINEYLDPAMARWYGARGIPHRRGYLFHGPPGTGKTSLSFALAGIFGLDIYCLALNDGITESELSYLFNRLPGRCILLFEDIDVAGIRREGLESPDFDTDDTDDTDDTTTDLEATEVETQDKSGGRLSKVLRMRSSLFGRRSKQKEPEEEPTAANPRSELSRGGNGAISLSGLLNVIDGAASHEGHVLIMTTNTPEKLDDALTRPGRVDLQIRFTLATRDQIRDMYVRMFSDAATLPKIAPATKAATTSEVPANAVRKHELLGIYLPVKSVPATVEPAKLEEMAQRFADALPEKIFSPAEIQGYLLMHKMDPEKAIEEVGKWKDEMIEVKKKKKQAN